MDQHHDVDRHKIKNIEVSDYLKNHKNCPYYDKAVRAVNKANGSGVVVGASVVSKIYSGVPHTRRTKRATVGKRMVCLHPTMGVLIKFITQLDIDMNTIGPVHYHCKNFVVENINPI